MIVLEFLIFKNLEIHKIIIPRYWNFKQFEAIDSNMKNIEVLVLK